MPNLDNEVSGIVNVHACDLGGSFCLDLGVMPKLAQQAGGKGLDGIQHGYCGVVFEAFASMHVACA